jgi:hypothetical protein
MEMLVISSERMEGLWCFCNEVRFRIETLVISSKRMEGLGCFRDRVHFKKGVLVILSLIVVSNYAVGGKRRRRLRLVLQSNNQQ